VLTSSTNVRHVMRDVPLALFSGSGCVSDGARQMRCANEGGGERGCEVSKMRNGGYTQSRLMWRNKLARCEDDVCATDWGANWMGAALGPRLCLDIMVDGETAHTKTVTDKGRSKRPVQQ